MAWITIDPSKVPLSAKEKTKVDATVGRGDTLPDIIASVVTRVCGRAGVRNTLGPVGTIPDEMLQDAYALIAYDYLDQDPTGSLITDTRKERAERAEKALCDLAKGLIRVVAPDSPAPKQAMPVMETIAEGNFGDTREDLNRL